VTGPATVAIDDLHRFVREALVAAGAEPGQAAICADVMVEQDLRDHGHHGSGLLQLRIADLRTGVADPQAQIEVLAEAAAMTAFDAHRALGPVAALRAMDACIAKARLTGIAMATVRQMPHWVIPAYYAMHAAAAGLIGYCACYTGPSFAPVGGRSRVLGNNPAAYAIPADPRPPLVADFGVSASTGRMRVMAARGEALPSDWAIDAAGNPITDPNRAMAEGIFLPTGGHKGYALGLVIELMCSALNALPIGLLRAGPGTLTGSVFMAWRTDLIRPHAEFLRDVNLALDAIAATPRRDPEVPIVYPGERSGYARRRNRARGLVDLPPSTWEVLAGVARDTGVALPTTTAPISAPAATDGLPADRR